MYSFRRFVVLLGLLIPASFTVLAQSSSNDAAASQQGQVTVQGRLKARREQRMAQAIRDTYSHTYEAFVGGGYQRLIPGATLQHLTMYSWDVALTRYFNERLGLTVDGRGYYGTAYVGLNSTSVTRPAISHYDFLVGPTYRFYMRPKYSVAGRVMGGFGYANFSSDTNGFGTEPLGLYPDGMTYALAASIIGEVNVSPKLSLRLAPEYYAAGFGSRYQNEYGFTYGLVYRFK